MVADAGPQVIHPQVNRAKFGKALQPLQGRLVHVARANGRHHGQPAHRVESGADNAAMNTVVGIVADQFMAHVEARRDPVGLERRDLQAEQLVEHNFFFKDGRQSGDELFFKLRKRRGRVVQFFGHALHCQAATAFQTRQKKRHPKVPLFTA